MTTLRRTYVDGPFGQVHLRIAGEATGRPPLFCFHMSPMSGRIFEGFAREMSADRLVVAVDTPGFGMSDRPPSPPEIGDYADTMVAAMDALAIAGPVDCMGYHTGSIITCDLARRYPDRVRKGVLVSAPILTEAENAEFRVLYQEVVPDREGEWLMKRWRGFVHYNLDKGGDFMAVADMFPDGLLGRTKGWWGHRAAFAYRLDMGLPEISQPLLIINPDDDLNGYTPRAAGLAPNSRIVDMPHWGHGFLDNHTAEAVALVRGFLDG